MIKSKTLRLVLDQACTQGIECCILFNLNGSMLAFSGHDVVATQMVAAIVANLCESFESRDPGMVTMIFDFEKGRIGVTRSSQFLLCMYGAAVVPFGMLKNKVEVLGKALEGPMDEVCAAQISQGGGGGGGK